MLKRSHWARYPLFLFLSPTPPPPPPPPRQDFPLPPCVCDFLLVPDFSKCLQSLPLPPSPPHPIGAASQRLFSPRKWLKWKRQGGNDRCVCVGRSFSRIQANSYFDLKEKGVPKSFLFTFRLQNIFVFKFVWVDLKSNKFVQYAGHSVYFYFAEQYRTLLASLHFCCGIILNTAGYNLSKAGPNKAKPQSRGL